jgi:hypothetical protein
MDLSAYPSIDAKLAKLRPTQMALGYAEVALKRKAWRALSRADARKFLAGHRFPAIRGLGGHYYIVDHHHLGRALLEEKVASAMLALLTDMSHLGRREFWIVMALRGWAHPFDARGRLRRFSDMPKKLKELPDDPYRSLAFEVRRAGGYPKETTPFAEFLWADFFRRRISAKLLRADPKEAFKRACKLAKKREASHLPDWVGTGEAG